MPDLEIEVFLEAPVTGAVLEGGAPDLEIELGGVVVTGTVTEIEHAEVQLPPQLEIVGVPGESAYEIAVLNGFVGDELDWLASLEGTPGDPGDDGGPGLSAYQVAVANGFVGDQAAWIASLEGQPGDPGDDGGPGLSAYEVAVASGFVGNQAAWLASLEGAPGDPGDDGGPGLSAYQVAVANGFVGTEAAWLASLEGPPGDPGDDGAAGIVLVNAGTNLSTARPAGVDLVYWKFSAGVDVGTDGANVVNGVDGDLYYVAGA